VPHGDTLGLMSYFSNKF